MLGNIVEKMSSIDETFVILKYGSMKDAVGAMGAMNDEMPMNEQKTIGNWMLKRLYKEGIITDRELQDAQMRNYNR